MKNASISKHIRRVVTGVGIVSMLGLWRVASADFPLDSRTVPHPEWVQTSGQVEQMSVVPTKSGENHLHVILRPTEGGRISIDFGPISGNGSFQPKPHDFIHVRGKAVEQEGHRTILAKEVFAEGRTFSIQQDDEAAEPNKAQSHADGASIPPSPAAPGPQR